MATSHRKLDSSAVSGPHGFEIISRVGFVEFGGEGSPVVAAMAIIGEQVDHLDMGEQREFTFDPTGMNEHHFRVLVALPKMPESEPAEVEEPWHQP
jgi:hypothetical protein